MLQWAPPANEDLLDQLWSGFTVDGSTAFVPGDDYGQEQDDEPKSEEEFQATPTPTSTGNQRSHRGKRT